MPKKPIKIQNWDSNNSYQWKIPMIWVKLSIGFGSLERNIVIIILKNLWKKNCNYYSLVIQLLKIISRTFARKVSKYGVVRIKSDSTNKILSYVYICLLPSEVSLQLKILPKNIYKNRCREDEIDAAFNSKCLFTSNALIQF